MERGFGVHVVFGVIAITARIFLFSCEVRRVKAVGDFDSVVTVDFDLVFIHRVILGLLHARERNPSKCADLGTTELLVKVRLSPDSYVSFFGLEHMKVGLARLGLRANDFFASNEITSDGRGVLLASLAVLSSKGYGVVGAKIRYSFECHLLILLLLGC
jgi:hypothetical protein